MSNSEELTRWHKFLTQLLWIICRGFAMLPRIVRHYGFGVPIYWILYYVMRYRRKVAMENLRNSFPEKSEKEIREICRKSYCNLAEQIINTISKAGVSNEELLHRMDIHGVDEVAKIIGEQSCVFLSAHFGPWEAGTTTSLSMPNHITVGVYHPLKNRVMDELMKRIRTHTRVELVPMKQTMRYFIQRSRQKPLIMGLIADQSPQRRAGQQWFKFLNQWTAFFDGGEVLARKYNLPVIYFSPRRIKAGIYEANMSIVYDGKEQVAEYEITKRYINLLEQDIISHPEMWMWTHRRWKRKPAPKIIEQLEQQA
ncbi:MAG: lysophospholipid acyltransferase family protein [Alistipes sp.]|nr:lysophospholipid acyltransferase family protein [Alistipes sp.]